MCITKQEIQSILSKLNIDKQYKKFTVEEHSIMVSQHAVEFGNHLELEQDDIQRLMLGGIVHDIGKVIFTKSLNNGQIANSKKDKDLIYNHPLAGMALIKDLNIDKQIKEIVLFHHERVDGTGYPHQLNDHEIPYLVKIITICDSYCAMLSKRRYKVQLTQKEAIKELITCADTQFDKRLVNHFVEYMKINKTIK